MSTWYRVKLAYQTPLGVLNIQHTLRAVTKDHAKRLAIESHGIDIERPYLSAVEKVRTPVNSRVIKTLLVDKTLGEVTLD